MGNDLVVQGSAVGGALSAQEVKSQVQLIQEVMNAVMKEGEHYGKIPGTKKNTLYKSGSEKLLLTFRLAAKYEEVAVQETPSFINYRIRCVLVHQASGTVIGEGLGACNSQEKKYRTVSVYENKATDEEKASGKLEKRKGDNGGTFNVYVIPANPYDVQNTIYKMACKRALSAAVLNCTAASDIFTQDLEDMDVIPNDNEKPQPDLKEPQAKKEAPKTDAPAANGKFTACVSVQYEDKDGQAKLKTLGFKWNTEKKTWSKEVTQEEFRKLADDYPSIEVLQ